MGQSTFPVPSSGSSTSTILPVNASSVILDGSLTTAGTYTTTVNGNGGIAYLTATDNPATITISGTAYSVPANTVVATTAVVGSGVSATVAANLIAPATFTASTMPSSRNWYGVTYGNGYFVAVAQSNSSPYTTTAGAYSTNGTTWTASTMPSSSEWWGVTYGNGYFVAVALSTTAAAYSTNGTTWTASTMPSSRNWWGVTYGNGYFVAVAQSTTAAAYSTNGTTWTASTMPVVLTGITLLMVTDTTLRLLIAQLPVRTAQMVQPGLQALCLVVLAGLALLTDLSVQPQPTLQLPMAHQPVRILLTEQLGLQAQCLVMLAGGA